ncbi:MAG TPA: DUF308 domain-containing protein [Candidatus Acidoferrum sp.]|nr:DUF308 domain-containing protein [Candidatus Acidoferrum sp.]
MRPPAVHDRAALAPRYDALHRAGIAVRGVFALALGVLALWKPGITTALVVAFAIFALVDGAIRIVLALRGIRDDPWWSVHFLGGVTGVVIGVVVLRIVHGLIALTWSLAEWTAIVGILSLIFAAIAWKRLHDAWLWAVGGVLLIAFAIILLVATVGGVRSTGYAVGIFGLIYGIISLVIAVRPHHARPLAPS